MPNPYALHEGERTKVFCVECYDLPVTTKQLNRWQHGELIQRVMPELTKADRELFISGLCGRCWILLFGIPPRTQKEAIVT